MNSFVYVPIVASLLVALLCRMASTRLWPRTAMWSVAAAAVIAAVSTVGALVFLASPLPARVPWIATVGRWRPYAVVAHSPVPTAISMVALLVVVVLAMRTARELRALGREAWAAGRLTSTIHRTRRGGVAVVHDDLPHAHAVGLGLTGRGEIIVSSSMLELLDADERVAMIAHERAHLRERHALFLAVVRVAAAMNPLIVSLRDDMQFALERSADEAAAAATERPVVASAVARAALAALDRAATPRLGLAFHPHRVTDRIQALLDDVNRRRHPSWILVSVLTVITLAFVWATHDTERFFEAVRQLSRR